MLNGLEAMSGLVPLGGGGSGTKGIAACFGLAIARRPLGVFEATMRDDKDENVRWLKRFDRAQEIVRACPDTRVVTVCDRKGDGAVVESDRDRRRPCGERLPAAARAVRRRQGPLRNGRRRPDDR